MYFEGIIVFCFLGPLNITRFFDCKNLKDIKELLKTVEVFYLISVKSKDIKELLKTVEVFYLISVKSKDIKELFKNGSYSSFSVWYEA